MMEESAAAAGMTRADFTEMIIQGAKEDARAFKQKLIGKVQEVVKSKARAMGHGNPAESTVISPAEEIAEEISPAHLAAAEASLSSKPFDFGSRGRQLFGSVGIQR